MDLIIALLLALGITFSTDNPTNGDVQNKIDENKELIDSEAFKKIRDWNESEG